MRTEHGIDNRTDYLLVADSYSEVPSVKHFPH